MPAITPAVPAVKTVEEPAAPAKAGLNDVSGPSVNLVNDGRCTATGDPALWKVNVAPETTAAQLKQNLARHVQKLADQKSTWSDDPNATARAAASQIFQALGDSTLAADK
jgi:hypothetical protein